MNKSRRKLCALLLCICMCLSGCGSSPNALLEERVDAPLADNQFDIDADLDYLSEEVCVIPKDAQTEKKSALMTAKAALMINDTDKTMLYSQNIYKKVYPASITKIVTALVTLKYGDLSDVVTVSHNASNITEYGAKLCGFKEGDKIVLKDLLYAFLIYSGNDAGIAIAEHIAGDVKSFATMMNQEMKAIGAAHSNFVNPHGLHNKKHYTTAYDLYLVFHELVKNETFLDIINQSGYAVKYSDKSGKDKELYFTTTDKYLIGLASPPEGVTVIGGKTGTTSDAGSCLILYSKGKKNKSYISVVLKAPGSYDLYNQMNYLLSYATK